MESHFGPVCDATNGFDIIDCIACGFKHVMPILSHEELSKIYRDEYYDTEKPTYIESHLEESEWWELVYGDRYDYFESFFSEKGRVLDIGSGPGLFLECGLKRGWEVLGIEPSIQASKYCQSKGLPVINKFFTAEVAMSIGKFDVLHLSEVLEHVANPHEIINLCKTVLRPGGVLCITTPNDYNPIQSVAKSVHKTNPWWVAPPHHLNYFSSHSLQQFVVNLGYKILNVEATFPLDIFLLLGSNYLGNDKIGKECHRRRIDFELNFFKYGANGVKRALYRKLAEVGLGREVTVYAQHKE